MHRSLLDSVAWIIALLLSGIAAGIFLMDFLGFPPVLPRLAPERALELYQQSLPVRRGIFQIAIAGSGLAEVVLLAFFSEGLSRRLLIAYLLCLVALVAYTNAVLVPLNREIASWNAFSPPRDWEMVFSKLLTRERLRSFLPAVALTLELSAFAARKNSGKISG